MARFGPIQMLSVGFDGNRFRGEILPELDRLKAQDVIRVLDLLFVRKDEAGKVATMTASDLDYEEAIGFGEYIGTAELADGHLFDADDAFQLTQALPNGMSAAILLLEHRWALPLLEAIERADGVELSNRWVNVEDLLSAGFRAADAPGPLEEPQPGD
jgi:hypothetical protein